MNLKTDITHFAKDLVARKMGEFFIYPMHDQTIEKIWQNSHYHSLLDGVLNDNAIPVEAKFLVCEIFFIKDILFMQRHPPEKIAKIYAHALLHNYTGMANSWGLLYDHQDDGTVGIAFLVIGKYSVPVLAKLLDNNDVNLKYLGSKEAKVGNKYNYRIKDFAAYYIGRIMGKSLKYFHEFSERDKQINDLKNDIKFLFTNKD